MSNKLAKTFIFSSTVILGLSVTALHAGTIVQNGSFENPIVDGNFDTSSSSAVSPFLTDWDVLGTDATSAIASSTSIDHIHQYWQAADGSQSLDMNGLDYGVIGQALTGLNPGDTYTLSFDMAGNPAGGPPIKTLEADVFIGSAPTPAPYAPTNNTPADDATPAIFTAPPAYVFQDFSFSIAGHSLDAMGWTLETMSFVAPDSGDVYLQFTSRTLANSGNSTYPEAFGPALDNVSISAVPLPGTAATLPALLGVVGIAGYFRRSAKSIIAAR